MTGDPFFGIRSVAARRGFSITRQGKRGWALLFGGRDGIVVLRRRESGRFISATRAAIQFLDALTATACGAVHDRAGHATNGSANRGRSREF